jgi:hypothetical protein
MNEIEKTEGEIKVLQAKLELLKEMELHKSPVEEAFKRVYGYYQEVCERSVWIAFKKGYDASKEDCKVVEEPEQATLYDVVRHGLEYSIDMCDEIVNSVRCWLPNEMEHDEDLNGYRAGWNDCINTLNKQLR